MRPAADAEFRFCLHQVALIRPVDSMDMASDKIVGSYLPRRRDMSESTAHPELRILGPVTITVGVGVAIVRPACEDLLRPLLSYRELDFCRDPRGHVQRFDVTKYVCSLEGDGLMITNGCIPRVVRHLVKEGYEVRVNDRRIHTDSRSQVDDSYIERAEAIVPGLAAALASHREGIIEVGSGHRKSDLLGTMCQLFHAANIFIACKTIDSTQKIAAELGPFLGGEVEAVHGWNWSSSRRVVCGTFGSLDRGNPSDWQILIFTDAFEGIQKAGQFARPQYCSQRAYALVDPARLRSSRDELLFEILAGPVFYCDPRSQRRPATEFLAAFATHTSGELQVLESARDRQVRLWDDSRRNQAVADVARALSCGDEPSLWAHDLFLQDDQSLSSLGPQPGVIVMVDSIEHGERLCRLLPGWHFFHGRPNHNTATTSGILAQPWGIPPNSVVTAVAANSQHSFHCRILVWASAGSVPFIPTIFGRSPRSHLLIDFWDDGNRHLAADTQQRLNVYRSIGCRVLGGNLDHRERVLAQESESGHPHRQQNTSRRRGRSQRPSV